MCRPQVGTQTTLVAYVRGMDFQAVQLGLWVDLWGIHSLAPYPYAAYRITHCTYVTSTNNTNFSHYLI